MKKMQLRQTFAGALVALLLLAGVAGVAAAQPSMVSYQGQLNVGGVPFTGTANFKFAIMCGTTSPWSNDGTSSNGSQPTGSVTLPVAQGVFSVLLGDPALSMVALTGLLINNCSSPDLRVWVDTGAGFEQLTDQPLASSPFALQATYAAGAIGTFKVTNGASTTLSLDGATGQAAVASIKFPDNTVQTTAAAGGVDSDWLLNGVNRSSGVTGNVGIGTVSPASKLHVLGSIRSDAVGGFDARNPNNTGALARLDWNLDIARIRVGGAGLGSLNGLDIEGISDVSWLRILNNGNVGINTTTPAERLVVNGNTVVTGNLTVQGTISGGGGGGSGIIAIPSSAFLESDTNLMDVHRSNVLLHGRTAGQGLTFEAPVYLPNGATITGFEIYVTDSDATRNVQTFLLSHPLAAGAGAILATLATSATPGRTVLTDNVIGTVVNNSTTHYVVACNWTTPTTVTNVAVHGMRITYTLP